MKKDITTKIYNKLGVELDQTNVNKFVKAVIVNFGDERGDIVVKNDNFGTRRKYADFTNGKKKQGFTRCKSYLLDLNSHTSTKISTSTKTMKFAHFEQGEKNMKKTVYTIDKGFEDFSGACISYEAPIEFDDFDEALDEYESYSLYNFKENEYIELQRNEYEDDEIIECECLGMRFKKCDVSNKGD